MSPTRRPAMVVAFCGADRRTRGARSAAEAILRPEPDHIEVCGIDGVRRAFPLQTQRPRCIEIQAQPDAVHRIRAADGIAAAVVYALADEYIEFSPCVASLGIRF